MWLSSSSGGRSSATSGRPWNNRPGILIREGGVQAGHQQSGGGRARGPAAGVQLALITAIAAVLGVLMIILKNVVLVHLH
jgi:hypothetical protein